MKKNNFKRIDTPAGWTDIMKTASDLAFRRLGSIDISNRVAVISFDSSLGHHQIKLHEKGNAFVMTEITNGEEKDTRELTKSMLSFIPTHIQIAHRTLGVTH